MTQEKFIEYIKDNHQKWYYYWFHPNAFPDLCSIFRSKYSPKNSTYIDYERFNHRTMKFSSNLSLAETSLPKRELFRIFKKFYKDKPLYHYKTR
jgi:hypothetical protein